MRRVTPLKRAIFETQVIQNELASEVGITAGYLSKIVNGLHCDQSLQDAIAEGLTRLDPDARVWSTSDLFPTAVAAAGA